MKLPFLLALLIISLRLEAQDQGRFDKEIEKILAETPVSKEGLIIFTGSSSVRMWRNVTHLSPDANIVNRGFGGSMMSDLYHYLDDLVLGSQPCQVFIYEGDNDLNAGKSIKEITQDAEMVCQKIWSTYPDTEIVLIAAKPSVARWKLKDQYISLNQAYAQLAQGQAKLKFVDIWTPALDRNGVVLQDIFLQDNLHMNEKGYAIWETVIRPYLRNCK